MLFSQSARSLAVTAVIAVFSVQPTLTAQAGGQIATTIAHRLGEVRDELIAVRRDIHRNPELSGEEVRTAGIVAARLRSLGFEVTTGVGGHGVVGVLEGAESGPVVAFRADMDAVTSPAPDPVEFASEVPGVRHVCGHDIHTTVGLGLAEAFAAVRADLPGTVKLIFQPSEENARGARAMLAEGVLENPEPQAIFAFHTAPYPVGTIGTQPGVALAGRDRVVVTLSGEGDLAQAADDVGGLLTGLTSVTPAQFQSVVDGDFIVVQVVGSEARPDGSWRIAAIATTTSDQVRAQAESDLRAALPERLPEGVVFELDYYRKIIAGVTNDVELEGNARDALHSVLGSDHVVVSTAVPPPFSEDFGSFQEEVPGVMYWLGVSNPEKGTVGMPHSAGYVADEEAIFVGARAMAAVMLDFLRDG